MVDSRLRVDPPSLFHCYIDISSPTSENALQVKSVFPEEFEGKKEILKSIPEFCYPCAIDYNGVQYSTFVLTDLESKFRFGFCRYPPHAAHCLCLISYLPWFETFYAVLDNVAKFDSSDGDISRNFLEILNLQPVPTPGSKLSLRFSPDDEEKIYKFDIPDTTRLPSIPDNRNLTEYFAKVTPENMVYLFISMLFERRIIVTSERLSVDLITIDPGLSNMLPNASNDLLELTAVVHGSVSLLYPMQWQHIYVPILPPHLIDYCCAPMPFLLGIHSSMMPKVEQMPMNEVVILNADSNEIYMLEDDLNDFPSKISSRMRKKLRRTDKALADYVSSQFLFALADLIGGYREALKFTETKNGEKIIFDDDAFLNTRTGTMKNFLVHILNQQSFRQFIAGRLEMLNDGVDVLDIFDQAVLTRNTDINDNKYKGWRDMMKKGGGAFKKTVEGRYHHMRGVNKLKNKMKGTVKDVKVAVKSKETPQTSIDVIHDANVKRNNSMPLTQKNKVNNMVKGHSRHSMYSSLPRRNITNPGRTPPPRPPRPDIVQQDTQQTINSVELPRKQYQDTSTSYTESRSVPNIIDLMDVNSSASSLDESSANSSFGLGLDATGGVTTSGSDSSIEHTGSYANPAFMDLHRKLSMAQEENVLEHNPLPKNDISDLSSEIKASCETEQKNNVSHSKKSLKRSVPVTSNRFKTPPARPPISPTTAKQPSLNAKVKTPPVRPPLPSTTPKKTHEYNMFFEDNNKDTFDDSFLVIHDENERIERYGSSLNDKNSITLPMSPFYSPSKDLLGLDHSLFHETMQSLSDDTRLLMSKSEQSREDSEGSHSPTIDMNFSFPSNKDKNICRSSVLTQNPFSDPQNTLEPTKNNKTQTDLFASIVAEARKEVTNASNTTQKSSTASVQPRALFPSSLRRSFQKLRKKDKRTELGFYQEV